MMSFKEWMVAEEARKVKPVDPDEVRLRALENEVAVLKKNIQLRKARTRAQKDIAAVHKAQQELSIQQRPLRVEDENWTLEGCLSPTFREIQNLDLPQFIQASLAELAKRIRPAELLRA